jgi:hypothetical protein
VLFRHVLAGLLALSMPWFAGVAVAADADAGSAERMLRAIYAPYLGVHADETAPPDFMRDKKFQENYEPSLAALIKEHSSVEDKIGEPLGLESDIFAHGQDWEIRKVDVTIQLGQDGHAAATVSFVSADQPDSVDFDLVWLKGRWRIKYLYWKDQDWSFRQQLADDIKAAKAELAHPSKDGD